MRKQSSTEADDNNENFESSNEASDHVDLTEYTEEWHEKPHVQPLSPIPPPTYTEASTKDEDIEAAIDAFSIGREERTVHSLASDVVPPPNWINHYPEKCRRHYLKCMTQQSKQSRSNGRMAYGFGEAGKAGVYGKSTSYQRSCSKQSSNPKGGDSPITTGSRRGASKASNSFLYEPHEKKLSQHLSQSSRDLGNFSKQSSQDSFISWSTFNRETRPKTVQGLIYKGKSQGFEGCISAYSAPLFMKPSMRERSRMPLESVSSSFGLRTPLISTRNSQEKGTGAATAFPISDDHSLKPWNRNGEIRGDFLSGGDGLAQELEKPKESPLSRQRSRFPSAVSSLNGDDTECKNTKGFASNYSAAGSQISKATVTSKVKAEVARKWEDQLLPTHKTLATGGMRAGAVPFRLPGQLTRERPNDVFGKKKLPANTTSDVPRMLYFHEKRPMTEQSYRTAVHGKAALMKQRKGMRPVRTSKACNRILVVYKNGRTDIVLQEEINKISSRAAMPGGLKIKKILPIF